MNSSISRAVRCPLFLLVCVLYVSGCSSSSDSGSDEPLVASNDTTSGIQTESTDETSISAPINDDVPVVDLPVDNQEIPDNNNPSVVDPFFQNTVLVSFDITVPAYSSNELRLEVVWGDLNLVADWVGDEFWSVTSELPTETEELLTINYYDNFGAVELARFSQQFITGSNPTEAFQVSADQFETDQFDDDGDGVSNMAELIAGSDPFIDEDSLLPIEDSFSGSNIGSSRYESRITDERPLLLMFQPSPNDPNQDSLAGSVDLDVGGNGTLIRNTRLGARYDDQLGTRTYVDGTVSWEGVVTGYDGSDYTYTINFSNTITLINENTRSYAEEFTSAAVGTYNFNSERRINLIGRLIEGTTVCEPVAGTYVSIQTSNLSGGRYSETSVSKDISEPYWRVSKVFNTRENSEVVTTEYFVRELSMPAGDYLEEDGFICDVVEF